MFKEVKSENWTDLIVSRLVMGWDIGMEYILVQTEQRRKANKNHLIFKKFGFVIFSVSFLITKKFIEAFKRQ